MDETEESEASPLLCPECGQAVESAEETSPGIGQCPHCGAQFFLHTQETIQEDAAVEEHKASKEEELDSLRIKQRARKKQSAIGTRAWCLAGMIAGLTYAIYAGILTVQYMMANRAWGIKPTTYAVFAVVLVGIAIKLWGKSKYFEEESRKSDLAEPEGPPSFEELSDGSQRVRGLEELRGKHSEGEA